MKDTTAPISIEPYKKTANAVFGFLTGLPQILSRIIFQRIVQEAYEIAQYQLKEDMVNQLSAALSSSYTFLPLNQPLNICLLTRESKGAS